MKSFTAKREYKFDGNTKKSTVRNAGFRTDISVQNFSTYDQTIMRKASCSCGGGCPSCKSNNLKVSKPSDAAEIEADQIADRVMRMPTENGKDLVTQSGIKGNDSTIHRKCSACDEEDSSLQRKVLPSANTGENSNHASVRSAMSSGGHPLDKTTRGFFEPRLGYDLSSVRVHTGSKAASSARSLNARAYTLGNNMVFGEGEFSPNSENGKHLLAHELAHVTQNINDRLQLKTAAEIPNVQGDPAITGAEVLGNKSCAKDCEDTFERCRKRSIFGHKCIAERDLCMKNCPPRSRACVVSAEIGKIVTPTVIFDDKVLMQFTNKIKWKNSAECHCSCGEYRQYVKGHIIKNGVRHNLELCNGATLLEKTYQEDGDVSKGFCYGHRNMAGGPNDIFDKADRSSGCRYRAIDEPSVPGKRGDQIDVDLRFKGQTYDNCQDVFGPIHRWRFTYKGSLQGASF